MRSQEVLRLQPLRQTTAVFFIVVNLFRNVVNHIRIMTTFSGNKLTTISGKVK